MGDPLGEHPGQRGGGGGDLGDQHGHAGGLVSRGGGAGVEAEPADPQHGRAHQGVTQVVRRHRRGREALALAQHQAGHQAGDTGVDVHHGAAGEVDHPCVPQQRAVTAPDHVGHRRVDHGEPHGHEDQHGGELHALGEGTHDQRRGDDGEGHLEGDEHAFREGADQAFLGQVDQEGVVQAADDGVDVEHTGFHAFGAEGQAVAVGEPEDAHQAGDGEALHHHRQDVLGTHHAGIEQRQAGDGHEQHQGGGGQHPGGVAGIQGGGFFLGHGQAWET